MRKIKVLVLLVRQLQHGFTKNAKVSPNLTVTLICLVNIAASTGIPVRVVIVALLKKTVCVTMCHFNSGHYALIDR